MELETPFRIWVTVCDEASEDDVAAALLRNSDRSNLKENGRGLIMMTASADDLWFSNSGNKVIPVFYRDRIKNSIRSSGQRANSHGFVSSQQSYSLTLPGKTARGAVYGRAND
ncbi:MAG: ATP-binding protein [Fuerstiella sp.]|jgi:hypothetical protein|nr:ATP-binding protein [Fuerstiella sp.]MCP4513496.1 ATP-binding protein [Fuerstiella sp.]MDG2131505.1 hypothetical protein [Fuerstiella sp.]